MVRIVDTPKPMMSTTTIRRPILSASTERKTTKRIAATMVALATEPPRSRGTMKGPAAAPPAHARELFLDVVDDVVDGLTNLPLRLAEALAELAGGALAAALGLELGIVDGFARLFLDVALRFFGLATNLVAIHARPPFRIASREKPPRSNKKLCKATASGWRRAVPLHV